MLKAIQPMLDSGIINEDTRTAIVEAWESQLTEAKEQLRAELREEFAQRYQHDKSVMVEALDKMVTESLTAELVEFSEEKQNLAEDRVKFKSHMTECAKKFNSFMVTKLAEEMKDLRQDREVYENSIGKLEKFVIRALAEEIQEFDTDKQDLAEAKVELIQQGKAKLAELQQRFVSQSAKMVQETVTTLLGSEITQLKEDIRLARENMFGRRLFEAFASEFAVTHLNENKEIAKLQKRLAKMSNQISESARQVRKAKTIVESKESTIRVLKESAVRKEQIADLLKPLNKEKSAIMRDLLENVQTEKLQLAYDKYLPAVLNNTGSKPAAQKTVALTESRVTVTGNKSANVQSGTQDNTNVYEIKRLAGLN